MNTLNFLVPTPDGYVWIGSQEGLVRFDGARFVSVDDIYGTNISGHSVIHFAVDQSGEYWVMVPGLGVYVIKDREVKFDNQPFPTDATFVFLSDGRKFICTRGNLFQWTGNHFDLSQGVEAVDPIDQGAIIEVKEGRIFFVGIDGALKIWNSNGVSEIKTSAQIIAFKKLHSGKIICKAKTGQFYVIENQQLKPYYFDEYHLEADWISKLHDASNYSDDKDDNLWFLTYQYGIGRLSKGNLEYLTAENGLPGDNMSFTNIGEDHEGNMWAASGMGLIKISDAKFSAFGVTEGIHVGGSSICADDDGNVWAGLSDDFIDKYNGSTFVGHKPYLNSNDLAKNTIYPSENGVWVGLRNGKLAHYANGAVQTYDIHQYVVEKLVVENLGDGRWRNQPFALVTDNEQNVWIALDRGRIVKFNGEHFSDLISLNRNHTLRAFGKSRNGDIWVGGEGPTLGKIINDEFVPVKSIDLNDQLFPGSVLALYEDSDGVLWAGTEYHGLMRLENDEVTWFSLENGLHSNRIFSILEDNSGRLWFSSNKGIFYVEKQQLNRIAATGKNETINCRVFNHLDGMRQAECNGRRQPVAWKAPDGRFWYVTVIGAVSIHPDSFYTNTVPPPVYVERVIANGQPGRFILPGENETQLSAYHRDLEIEYTALSYVVSERVMFKYQLEGYDDDWIDAGNRRSAFYTNLSSGSYTFRVKACNNDGVWNETGASLAFVIPPFWYETWWAKSIFGMIAVLFVALAVRLYIRKNLDRQHMRMKAEQATRLEQLDRLKTQFFANISHEFRTPLTLILGPLEQFLDGKVPAQPQREFRIMHRNARRLQRLINQLLDLSKLDAGGLNLQAQPTELVRYLNTLCMAFLSHAERQGIRLQLDLPDGEQIAHVDRDKFEKIITNLLSNAFKFTPRGGEVRVGMTFNETPRSEPMTEITVSDSGKGIAPEALPHIFDRFYQADGGQTRTQEGSGIGLALTRELVALHHGEIAVASDPGKGTTFTVRLPMGTAHLRPEEVVNDDAPVVAPEKPSDSGETAETATVTKPPPSATPKTAPTVLIVEDNADLRYYLRSQLQGVYRIAEAENGQTGVARAQEILPDLVISDVMMPEMDGFELCRQLKTDQRTSHIPVVLLTALAAPENRLEGLETRADDYIVKPFDAGELRARVRNLIENRELLRQRYRSESGIQPTAVTVNRHDEAFLKKALAVVEQHLADTGFSIEMFATEMNWSAKTLQRKIRALTGLTAHDFIYDIRLKTAARLLRDSDATITIISYDTGFSSPGHLARQFRQRFGVSPSDYRSDYPSQNK